MPAIWTVLPSPMFAFANVPFAELVTITTSSPLMTPAKAAFDVLITAVVVPSYPRFEAVMPVTVSSLVVMFALVVGWVSV